MKLVLVLLLLAVLSSTASQGYRGDSLLDVMTLLGARTCSTALMDESPPADFIAVHATPPPPVLPTVQLSVNLSEVLESQCALLCVPPCDPITTATLLRVNEVFRHDSSVFVGTLTDSSATSDITWKHGTFTHHHNNNRNNSNNSKIAFYEQLPRDRTCLMSPPTPSPKAALYTGQAIPELLVQFLNEKCQTHRTITGALTAAGIFHSFVMDNLYRLDAAEVQCPRLSRIPDRETFFQQFLFRSRPVVLENAAGSWPAMRKWTTEHLRGLYGRKRVHVKLTPDGEFEGVESASLWRDYRNDWIPESVRSQLSHPDLVVVRPASVEITFSQFLDYIASSNRSFSAYLEYSSIPFHLPLLEEDVREMPFLEGFLERRHLNIWLSDGNTLGKLHFDPFDNFLCQISGEKHLTLFEPHENENLYEGHIPEAMLSVSFPDRKSVV